MHARAQSTHAITKMHASTETVIKSVHRKLMLRKSREPEIKSAENICIELEGLLGDLS